MTQKIAQSIIIPCKNEENYIANCLNYLLEQDIDFKKSEIFVVDGLSTDNTIEIVKSYEKKHPCITLLHNKHQTVPYAMNLGIEKAKGTYIIRIDAHATYPKNYISTLLYWHKKLKADNVGALCKTLPPDNTIMAKTIATSISHPFGVGNSHFRIGSKDIKQVDTVPFGCYKKSLFDKIGLYDTELTRNQDDELNARIIKNKGKIYLISSLIINYYPRSKLTQTIKMFYQYGLFKPLILKKLKKPSTIRQLIPFLFVTTIICNTLLLLVNSLSFYILCSTLILYSSASFIISTIIFIKEKKKNIIFIFSLMLCFFSIHVSYGIGYAIGILQLISFNKHKKNISISR